MYLLDTNVVSELRKLKSGKADRSFVRWFEAVSVEMLYVSVITLFEIENGIALLERRDASQAALLRSWFENAQVQLEGRVIAIDRPIALYCARIVVPDPRPWRDAFIGATAVVHGLSLVTRNVRDFRGLDIDVINPWQPAI